MSCDPVPIIPSLGCCATQSTSPVEITGKWIGFVTLLNSFPVGPVSRFLRIRTRRTYTPVASAGYAGGFVQNTFDYPKWIATASNYTESQLTGGDTNVFGVGGPYRANPATDSSNPANIYTNEYTLIRLRGNLRSDPPGVAVDAGYVETFLETEWTLSDALAELVQVLGGIADNGQSGFVSTYSYNGSNPVYVREVPDNYAANPRATASISSSVVAFDSLSRTADLTLRKHRLANAGTFCKWTGNTKSFAITNQIECLSFSPELPQVIEPLSAVLSSETSANEWQKSFLISPTGANGRTLSFLASPLFSPACCNNPFA